MYLCLIRVHLRLKVLTLDLKTTALPWNGP